MLKYLLNDRLFASYTVPFFWFIGGILVVFLELVVNMKASYGRYNSSNSGIPVRTAWILQELPSFAVPCVLLIHHWSSVTPTKFVILSLFLIHYFQRYVVSTVRSSEKEKRYVCVSSMRIDLNRRET